MVLIRRCKLQTSMLINVSLLCCSRTDKCAMDTHVHANIHSHFMQAFFINCIQCVFKCVSFLLLLQSPATFNTFLLRLMVCLSHFSASIFMNAYTHTASNLIGTAHICICGMYVAASLKQQKCMRIGNALKLVTPGYKSVNQRTCVSAEDCRTEVLTLQRREGWWVVGGWSCGWTKIKRGGKRESNRNEQMQNGSGRRA